MGSVLSLAAAVILAFAVPQEVTVDTPRRLAMDSVLERAVHSLAVPGGVALVTTVDEIVYQRTFGSMDELGHQPMVPDAVFRIASMTKPLTSLAAMMLVEEGRLDLDLPVSHYLDEFEGRGVLVAVDTAQRSVRTRMPVREPTVRDLLRHTSGVGYEFTSYAARAVAQVTNIPDRGQPLLHDPGAHWTYGMGPAHVGWIIERIAGQPLSQFFAERIFGPLGMVDTSFRLTRAESHRLVTLFRREARGLVALPRPDSIASAGRGDGGLLSTAGDYARFLQLILGEGQRDSVRLIEASTLAEMTHDQLGGLRITEQPAVMPAVAAAFPKEAGRDVFGLGFQIAPEDGEDGRAAGSLTWSGAFNTYFWIDLRSGVGAILMFQLTPYYDPQVVDVLRAFERALYRAQVG